MTKLRKIILIPALVIVSISGFFSCGVDRWPEYAHMTALDTWMYDIMQQNYLWYQDLPSYDDANLFLEPAQFLSKVKSKNDSYSFVEERQLFVRRFCHGDSAAKLWIRLFIGSQPGH